MTAHLVCTFGNSNIVGHKTARWLSVHNRTTYTYTPLQFATNGGHFVKPWSVARLLSPHYANSPHRLKATLYRKDKEKWWIFIPAAITASAHPGISHSAVYLKFHTQKGPEQYDHKRVAVHKHNENEHLYKTEAAVCTCGRSLTRFIPSHGGSFLYTLKSSYKSTSRLPVSQ